MPQTFSFEEATQPETFSFEEAIEPAVPDVTRQPRAATAPVPSPFNYFTGGGFERTRQQIGEFGKLPLAEKKETALTPTVQLPKFTVQPDDSFIAGLAKESANQLIGLPEFATSPVSIATAGVGPVAGKIGQTAIRVGFLADTIYNFLKQAPSDIDAYIKASPGEKGAMIARWAGTGALAGTLASPEIKRAGDAIKRVAPILPRAAAAAEEAIAEAPPIEQPAAPAAEPEGGPSAIEIRSTEEVPQLQVRPQVGQETPLRQQREPAPAGAPEAPASEVAPVESPPPSTGPTTEAAASTETPTTTPQPSEKAGAALPAEKPAETTAAPAAKEPWQMTKAELAGQTKFNKAEYGSLPWSAEVMGKRLVAPEMDFDHPDLGKTRISGAIRWNTKKQAQAVIDEIHKRLISKALSEGKPVPAEVLADYPDLKPPAPKPAEARVPERIVIVNVRGPKTLAVPGAKRHGEMRFGGTKFWSIPESQLPAARKLGATLNKDLTKSAIQPSEQPPPHRRPRRQDGDCTETHRYGRCHPRGV